MRAGEKFLPRTSGDVILEVLHYVVRNNFLLSRNQRLYFIEEQGRIHCKIYEESSKNGGKNGGMQYYWGKKGKK